MNTVGTPRALLLPLRRQPSFLPGLALVGAIAAAATWAAGVPGLQGLGLGALTLAIVAGIALGNTVFPAVAVHTAAGVDFAKAMLLRTGIVLYGFRLTFQDIAAVGVAGVVIDVLMMASVFAIAVQVGTRVLRMDRETAMLIGAGSAVCGAAAVMAAEPVVRAQAHKVSVAVATVVVFGTTGMFLYPALFPHLGLSEHAYGVFAGSTIHEVAQVVVAGRSVGETAASAAVIEKMLRVMLLAPFLLLLSVGLRRGAEAPAGGSKINVPWFAVLFVAVAAFNSLHLLPAAWVQAILQLDGFLLAMAMAALGLRTQASAIRQAGAKPLLLASILFGWLVFGGLTVNLVVARLIG